MHINKHATHEIGSYPHYTDEKTEAQRAWVTASRCLTLYCYRSHSVSPMLRVPDATQKDRPGRGSLGSESQKRYRQGRTNVSRHSGPAYQDAQEMLLLLLVLITYSIIADAV